MFLDALTPLSYARRRRSPPRCCSVSTLLSAADGPTAGRLENVPEVVVLNDNGAWSWFEDERAVVDRGLEGPSSSAPLPMLPVQGRDDT